jgi:UMF1 family MFS transporter
MHLTDSILFAYCLSFAFVIIALINPILSGIADSAGTKKLFMKIFVLLGGMSCLAMIFFDKRAQPVALSASQ